MTVTSKIGSTYRTYNLDPTPIGSGGEGDIYNVLRMDKVAKIYKPGALTGELEEKLGIMIGHPPEASVLTQVAWPLDMVYDGDNCLGFVMPKLKINAELGEVYKYPSSLPISYHQKINIAQNICAVISEVHKAGYVFGDFNPRNIGLDTGTGLVSFLDTDTYHVEDQATGKTHRCNVCAPGYAAPELLEKCSAFVAANPTASKYAYAQTPLPTFTKETDNFALAIHIFKLLMNGYTPFGGIIETASVSQSSPGVGDAAVRRDSYCFKPGYKHQSAAILPLEALPQEVADLFTRAFILGKIDPHQRPDAAQWHGALTRYEQSLITCPANPLHQYDKKNTKCPLCEADRQYQTAVGGSEAAAAPIKQSAYATPPGVVQGQPTNPPVSVPGQRGLVTAPAQTQKGIKPDFKAIAAFVALILVIIIFMAVYADIMHTDRNNSQNRQSGAINSEPAQVVGEPSPSPSPLPSTQPEPEETHSQAPSYANAKVGDIIQFGGYDWRVLDVQGNNALIVTDVIIEQRRYHSVNTDVTWGTSEIRAYLNGEFFNRFSADNRSRIRETAVINNDQPWDFSQRGSEIRTPGGANTTDRIFLLSIDEVLRYFGDSGTVARGALMNASERAANQPQWPVHGIYDWGIHDQYSAVRIARDAGGTALWWWLRSPGHNSISAARVRDEGNVSIRGNDDIAYIASSGSGIRPALWLNLEP